MAPIASSYFALIPPFLLALLSSLLWGSWWLQRRSTHLLWMGACCAVVSLPYSWQVLMPTPEIASWAPLLTILYYAAAFCWVQAVALRMRVPLSRPFACVIFVALMVTNVFFARFDDNIGIRVAALCIFLGLLTQQCTPRLLRAPRRGKLEHTIVGVHIAFGIFLLFRPLLFLPEGGHLANEQPMRDTLFWWVTVTGSLLFCMLLSCVLLASGLQETLQSLHKERSLDPLTDLLNRRGFNEAASQAMRRNQALRTHTVVLCDLDLFKQVNDRWGHAQGDQVLQMFATHLRQGTRDSDLLARFGGEEFVLLLLDVQPAQVLPLLECLRQQFHAQTFKAPGGNYQVSASFGVAALRPGDPMEQTLQRADAQLYRAKQTGRNRICVDVDGAAPNSTAMLDPIDPMAAIGRDA